MNLFDKIEQTLAEIKDGWCSIQKAKALASSVIALRPEIVVEIGTYSGRSFIPMLMALHENGFGKAVGIDPYSASASAEGEIGENAEWWKRLDHEKIRNEFIQRIEPYNFYAEILREK